MRKKQKQASNKDKDTNKSGYQWKEGEKSLFQKRSKRFEVMYKFKTRLGIDQDCDDFDRLFTPHLVALDEGEATDVQSNSSLLEDKLFTDKARKSMPIFFEKVTTATSLMVKENPKGVMKPAGEKYRDSAIMMQNTYYANFASRSKKEVLEKYIYHLSKYGIAYWREYIKKTWRYDHFENADGTINTSLVIDVFDVVGEVIHPKMVILDNNCHAVKDINKPARDVIILEFLTQEEFEAKYPTSKFPNGATVKENGDWMLDVSNTTFDDMVNDNKQRRIQVLTYENYYESLRETWANGTPIESIPLPGKKLSINGDKWLKDKDNYKGIGLGHIIRIYGPIVDDIVNASLERLRQIVRPNEDWFNGVEQTDESEDVLFGSSSVRKFNGSTAEVKYTTPPSRTDAEAKEKEEVLQEVDLVTSVPRTLSGSSAALAKTAYQDAMIRESALQKFNLPLGAIKRTIESAANLDLELYKIAYTVPLETIELAPSDDGFDEGMAILQQSRDLGIDDPRVAVKLNEDGTPTENIYRRKFKTFELPLKVQEGEGVVDSDEKTFWESVPSHFDFEGSIEIIGESFLPISKALEDTQDKETIEYLMNIPTTDDMGRPALTDAAGKPYTIDKVRLLKARIALNRNFDPDKLIVPMTPGNADQGNIENPNPLDSETDISVQPPSRLALKKV